MRKKNGFTLIELLVVMVIIAILVVVVAVAYEQAQRQARDAQRVADLQKVQSALTMYYQDNKSYSLSGVEGTYKEASECPVTIWTGDIGIVKNALIPDYLPSWPRDPLRKNFVSGDQRQTYCYIYKSNGVDYAFLLLGDSNSEMNWTAQSDLVDTARSYSWKVYSAGGKNW